MANPGANITNIVRQGNQATTNLNVEDAGARLDNLRQAMQIRGQLAQQKLAQQQYNSFDKYTEQFNQAAALQGASNQNLQGVINGASGITSSLAMNRGFNAPKVAGQGGGNWGMNDPFANAMQPSGVFSYGGGGTQVPNWGTMTGVGAASSGVGSGINTGLMDVNSDYNLPPRKI